MTPSLCHCVYLPLVQPLTWRLLLRAFSSTIVALEAFVERKKEAGANTIHFTQIICFVKPLVPEGEEVQRLIGVPSPPLRHCWISGSSGVSTPRAAKAKCPTLGGLHNGDCTLSQLLVSLARLGIPWLVDVSLPPPPLLSHTILPVCLDSPLLIKTPVISDYTPTILHLNWLHLQTT